MNKIAIALSALAGIVLLSGCAYDGYAVYHSPYAYNYAYPYAYAYGYGPGFRPRFYWQDGVRYDCVYRYNSAFCG